MVRYCLDTNVIIDFFRGDDFITDKIRELSSDELFFTAVSLCEIFRGIYLYSKNEEQEIELRDVQIFLQTVKVLSLDIDSCREFGKIFAELKKKGKMTQESDLMIASIAKTNNAILVTRNKKHFENTGIKIEVW